MVTEFLSQWHSTWAWQGSKLQPQIFKTVEFPSLADVFPPNLSGGIAENLWGREPIPVHIYRAFIHCVYFQLFQSKQWGASLPPPGAVLGCFRPAGLSAYLVLLCDSAVPVPGASFWPGLGGHPCVPGKFAACSFVQGSAASTQAKPDSSSHWKQLSYRNYENLGFPRAYSLQNSWYHFSLNRQVKPEKTFKSWACEWKFITLQSSAELKKIWNSAEVIDVGYISEARVEDSAGRPQTFTSNRLWGCKSPGIPLFRVPLWMHQLKVSILLLHHYKIT